ncbi:carbon monoxide dehydrogenase subunit G [Xanthobacter dioxanivorans]|uniref:Carbon monoxide dehydrogenase subunit G n=1 Tax=Xanthobacter dioxanivorans TaxID=2528964 RepID=A0A974PPE7_9HYPH|nr:carbon monoxide dehydrogenase subunit G [Xanthobacter dioxanivorans]QRG07026.1 carbon monoxide dehydrogenase subunit G [Xanthobacter dioxanivorans]
MALVFTGSYLIPAPRERVWASLNDPDVLARCIPGCTALTATGPDSFAATVVARIGVISTTFKGDLHRAEADPPSRYVLNGRANGGLAGFARGGAEILLDAGAGPDSTVLTYRAEADIGGKVAMVGGRLIQSVAKSLADDFFGAFARELGGDARPLAPPPRPAAPPATSAVGTTAAAPPTSVHQGDMLVPVRVATAFLTGIAVGIAATGAAALALGLAR